MTIRRIIYALALAGTLLFQIYFHSYYAPLLLVLTLAVPVLSLLLSVPAMTGLRLQVRGKPLSSLRGSESLWILKPELRGSLPLARLTARVEEKNLLTGREQVTRLALKGVARGDTVTLPAATDHCGVLELRVKKLRVYDWLGLFAFPVRAPEPARLPVFPDPVSPGPLNLPEGMGIRPTPGSTMQKITGEDYDLREYRPGDPLRSVHWKLTSKWDELIVREAAETVVPPVLLAFERFGPPERLDRLLDRVSGFSHALLEVQRPHALCWRDGAGRPVRQSVSDLKQLQETLLALLSTPAPLSPPQADESAPYEDETRAILIHITSGEEAAHGQTAAHQKQ